MQRSVLRKDREELDDVGIFLALANFEAQP
jgi:hypothetical protein